MSARACSFALCACLLIAPLTATAAPGDHFQLSPAALPAPNTTRPRDIDASFVNRPPGALPRVPPGFTISEFAAHLKHPRALAVAPDGDVYLVEEGPGKVLRLRDSNGGGKADQIVLFASGFKGPHGIAIHNGELYIGDTMAVWRTPYANRSKLAVSDFHKVTAVPDLRPDGWHSTRDIVFDSKGRLYLSVGSRNDVSEQPLPDASIELIAPDGSMTPFARGLRNVEGLAFYPGTDDLWVTCNERDALGARLPPDYMAHVRAGDFFGWPYAYIGPHPDPVYGAKRPDLVARTKTPEVLFEAHSAPLGLVFYTGKQFPPAYRGDAFVAFHGSGPYDKPDGYKVVRVRFKDKKPVGGYEDFVTGFADKQAKGLSVWGTPSQLAVAKDGSLLLADDKAALIWRIAYTGHTAP